MEVCGGKRPNYHEEIVYNCDYCPLCRLQKETNLLEREIEELKDKE